MLAAAANPGPSRHAVSTSTLASCAGGAAMVAGATRRRAIMTITMPLVRGGVVASAFLMVVLGLRELTASLLLYTTKTRVLSIVIYEQYVNGNWAQVSALSLIYTSLLVILTLAGRRWLRAQL